MIIQEKKMEKNDIIIVSFPALSYDLNEAKQIVENIQTAMPNHTILAIPEDITLSFIHNVEKERNPFL